LCWRKIRNSTAFFSLVPMLGLSLKPFMIAAVEYRNQGGG